MSVDSPSLEDVRREIDRLDDALHDLVLERARLVDRVIEAKLADGTQARPMRPGREVEILRRLAARHRGRLPVAAVLRIWRELINAITALQGPFSVAVCAPARSVGYWDLARNHFGATTPMTLHVAPSVVLRAVTERPGTVGVLPEPQDEDAEPWWLLLASSNRGGGVPRVIWRLPYFAAPAGRFESLGALAVACMAPERSSDDESVAAFDCHLDVSRGRLLEALEAAGMRGRIVASHEGSGTEGRMHLALIDGFVTDDDPRLSRLGDSMGEPLYRVAVLGAYPRPMSAGQAAGQTGGPGPVAPR